MGNESSRQVLNHRYPSGNVYSGHLQGNKRHGQGQLTWPDGATYVGSFVQDKLQGQGKLSFPNGSVYEGGFHQNNPHGEGKLKTKNGEVLTGTFKFLGRSDRANTPVGKYEFSGQLIDLKTNYSQRLNGPLALYLVSGLVSLPNMNDPMEAMLPYATATAVGGDDFEKGEAPMASVVQTVTSTTSGSISYGQPEVAFNKRHADDHTSVDVLDPRLWLASVGVPVNPGNTNARRQQDIRNQEQQLQYREPVPIATAVPVYKPQ